MRVLLTGAFGNIGKSALEALLERGHQVRCFDVPTRANVRAAREMRSGMEIAWGDLRREDDLASAVHGVDIVIHLAFIIPKLSATGVESEQHPEFAYEVNVGGTRNLIRAMQSQPCPPKLIFASSVHVYGRTQGKPAPRTVDDPLQPVEHYSHHKVICERMVRDSGLTWSIFRFGAALPINLILHRGMFDVPVENRIEFVHTRDVGTALANAVTTPAIWGRTLLIGGGPACQFTYGEMVTRILDNVGIGGLPAAAFGRIPFAVDFLDTEESQALLHYQRRDLDDYLDDIRARLGFRRAWIRALRPWLRAWLLSRSPYLRMNKMRSRWEGRVALVTGGSSGIGAATARLLARHGLSVAIVARRGERLRSLADEINASGGRAISLTADLTREEERVRLVETVDARLGPVDVLVNNAGIAWYGYGEQMSWQEAWRMIQLNLVAAAHLTLRFLPQMKARRSGHIINIGSIAGGLPSQGVALYGATKAFIDNFTTALHRELRGTGVRLGVVRSGSVRTELSEAATGRSRSRPIPAQRFGISPERVAERVWDMLRHPRRVIYVPSPLRLVPWFELCFGWLIDRLGPLLLERRLAGQRIDIEE